MGSAMKNHRYAIRENAYQEYWQVHKRQTVLFFLWSIVSENITKWVILFHLKKYRKAA